MTLRCSLCGKPYNFEYVPGKSIGNFPFCSKQCKLLDLGKWLDEEHRLSTPVPELEGLTEEERQVLVQYLLDSGLVDAVSEGELESETDQQD